MQNSERKLGDFTGLAKDYAQFRQGYSPSVLTALLAIIQKPVYEIDAVDLGAGTGIWTRMLAARDLRSVTAVEPNSDMFQAGSAGPRVDSIAWVQAPGEATGLPSATFDLVTAASSFHWMDFDKTTREIARLLRSGGRFVALWNPRRIEPNTLLGEIEGHLKSLAPEMKRVSSGKSAFTESLGDRLSGVPGFTDLIFIEGRHVVRQTAEAYLGAWNSVNDVQAQLGAAKWRSFLDFVKAKIADQQTIETEFLTRAWSVRYAP